MMNAVDNLRLRSQGAEFVSQIVHHIDANFCAPQARLSLTQHLNSRFGQKSETSQEESELLAGILRMIQRALSNEPDCELGQIQNLNEPLARRLIRR
jgi:hypothetical protein